MEISKAVTDIIEEEFYKLKEISQKKREEFI